MREFNIDALLEKGTTVPKGLGDVRIATLTVLGDVYWIEPTALQADLMTVREAGLAPLAYTHNRKGA